MWTVYKKEIIEREKEDEFFLQNYYKHAKERDDVITHHGTTAESEQHEEEAEEYPVELESDEEDLYTVLKKHQNSADQGEGDDELKVEKEEKTVLEQFASQRTLLDQSRLPKWLYKYLVFRFNLLDRTGESNAPRMRHPVREMGACIRTYRASRNQCPMWDT